MLYPSVVLGGILTAELLFQTIVVWMHIFELSSVNGRQDSVLSFVSAGDVIVVYRFGVLVRCKQFRRYQGPETNHYIFVC
jgi:hypothetical protein